MDSRSSENIRSLRIMILILVSVITLYLIIITSVGYQPKKIGSGSSSSMATTTYSVADKVPPQSNPIHVNHEAADSSPDPSDKSNQQNDSEAERRTGWHFRITGFVMLGVMVVTAVGVVRESPMLIMLSSIALLLAVAQSVQNTMSNIQTDYPVFKSLMFSPAAFLGGLGCLLAIYTALIWASEFETPPHVIDEYKWYLNQIRGDAGYVSPPQLQQPRLSVGFNKSHSRGGSSVSNNDRNEVGD